MSPTVPSRTVAFDPSACAPTLDSPFVYDVSLVFKRAGNDCVDSDSFIRVLYRQLSGEAIDAHFGRAVGAQVVDAYLPGDR